MVLAAGSFSADAESERLLLSAACDGAAAFAAASLKESFPADAELELLALLEATSTFPIELGGKCVGVHISLSELRGYRAEEVVLSCLDGRLPEVWPSAVVVVVRSGLPW